MRQRRNPPERLEAVVRGLTDRKMAGVVFGGDELVLIGPKGNARSRIEEGWRDYPSDPVTGPGRRKPS